MKRMQSGRWIWSIIAVLAFWTPGVSSLSFGADEILALAVNPAPAGQTATATIWMENVADVESLSLELGFASGSILTLPAVNWFAREDYFPESPFGAAPDVDRNDRRVIAGAGRIHLSGFSPYGTSGNIGQVTFNVSPGATTGATQVLSLSGMFFSRSEQTVKQLAPVSAVFTVGALPNILPRPSVRLFAPIDPGAQSAPQPVVVRNTGQANLVVGTLGLYGTHAAEFTIFSDGCSGQTLLPGESRTVQVVFAPASGDMKIAYLSIPSSDPDTPALIVPLKKAAPAPPDFTDTDDDGILDSIESAGCTDPFDADTDDDGIADGAEDANHNGIVDAGETNPCNIDTDGDGIQDGTEMGLTLADIGPDTDTGVFQPDLDNSTTTNPLNPDSDGDGVSDGKEDANLNGRVDAGEYDPLDSSNTPPQISKILEWNGNLVADFGEGRGLYMLDGSSLTQLTGWGDVHNMIVWGSTLVVDFGYDRGLFANNGSGWTQFTGWGGTSKLLVWENGTTNPLVVDFGGGRGLYYNDGTTWNFLTGWDGTNRMLVWNNSLVVDFGESRGLYYNDGIWNELTGWDDTVNMITWNTGASDRLVVDFGGGRGLYYNDGSSWNNLTGYDEIHRMITWGNNLVVDFGQGRGLHYNDGTWHELMAWDNTAELLEWGTGLVSDFGPGKGVYKYTSGTWTELTGWSTAD